MRILIIGGGGREHAIGWALSRSPRKPELFFAPGNAGTASIGRNVDVGASDTERIFTLAKEEAIDLTIVGPEVPLVNGLVDRLEAESMRVVGPTAGAARLEGSKSFSKAFMERHNIPTARHRTFVRDQIEDAHRFVTLTGAPIVVKASGLAAGKGAIVCQSITEAHDAIDSLLAQRSFGSAGDEVVIEEFMTGEEASLFVLTDGESYRLLPAAQDHKQVGEGDTGPNTGGMGAYAPAPIMTPALTAWVERDIVRPTLDGMRSEGHPYRGVLYVGLMITDEGPRVIEYNCRFGDPEAQVLLPLLESDALDVFERIESSDIARETLRIKDEAAATIVLASGGYPGTYSTGFPIDGLEEASAVEGVHVFHAGTLLNDEGRIVTAGGRVLNVTGTGPDLKAALERAYRAADLISFEGKYVRRDIGWKGLDRLRSEV